ncbi:thioredoxin family protein [Nitrobacter sp.]|uniref:thioredoxin family protein n=1 Tax=Nitrobacter sp. TaxID=29420 RepID=UPI003F65306F
MQSLPFRLVLATALSLIFCVSGIAQQASYKQPALIEALRRGDAGQLALPDPERWIGAVRDNSAKATASPEEEEEREHSNVAAKLIFRAAYVMAFAERFAGTCPLARRLPTAEIKKSLKQIRDWTAPSVSAATTTQGADLTVEQEGQLRLNRFILDGADDAATFQRLVPCDSVVTGLVSRALVDLLSSPQPAPAIRPKRVELMPDPTDEIPGVLIGWETDIIKALKASQADGKRLLVFFRTASCPWCDALAREFVNNADLNANAGQFRAVIAAVEADPPNVAYGLHQKIGLDVFPVISILTLDKDGTLDEHKRYSGYFPGPDLAKRLSTFLGNKPQTDKAAFDKIRSESPRKPAYCWKIETFSLCMARLNQ